MIKNLSLIVISLFISHLGYTQIIHVDYGSGLIIEMNENYSMDIDADGGVDFYINQYNNELAFTPIKAAGCFTSDYENDLTPWGANELSVHEKGDIISITEANMDSYIDEGRAGIFSVANGYARDWNDNEDQYIGFAVLIKEGVMNGWMRAKIDQDLNAIVIYEYAYQDIQDYFEGSIVVGDMGEQLVSAYDLKDVLNDIVIRSGENSLQIDYKYSGKENLQSSVLNFNGQVVLKQNSNGHPNQTFDTTNWTSGMYLVNFSTPNGIHTEKVFISK